MIKLALQLFESPDGAMIADFSHAQAVACSTNKRGFLSLTFFVPMPLLRVFIYYNQALGKHLSLNYGAGQVWEGRVEDRAIVNGGLQITAMGYWQSMFDAPYTALWSASGSAGWVAQNQDDYVNAWPDRYEMDNNNRLYMALRKGESYSSTKQASYGLRVPSGSGGGQRQIVGIQFEYEFVASSDYHFQVIRRNSSWVYSSTEYEVVGDGSLKKGAVFIDLTSCNAITIRIQGRSASETTYTGETGVHYLKITRLRVVTSTTEKVDTTTTTSISIGSQIVAPALMDRIYVGQRLFVDAGLSISESVEVTAVTSTTFTATFINAYSGTTTIQAHVVHADRIVKALVNFIVGINSSQLSSSWGLIQSPGLDLLDELYEDMWPGDVCLGLVGRGDDQTPPRQWEVGVWEGQKLHFRPRGSDGKSWSVDIDFLGVQSSMSLLVNSAYAIYQDGNNETKRTAVADDTNSQSRYEIIRRSSVGVQTTNDIQASVTRDAFLEDRATIRPRSSVLPDQLQDSEGSVYPKWYCRSGDKIELRNFPVIAGNEIDRVRIFVVSETRYLVDENRLEIVPELPLPSLERLVAENQ